MSTRRPAKGPATGPVKRPAKSTGREAPGGDIPAVPIREDSIRLGQFLKLADLVDTGSDVKPLLADGDVRVNGEVETRRGRQLVPGDVVTLDAPAGLRTVRVAGPAAS